MPSKTSFFICFATLLSFCLPTFATGVQEQRWIDDKIKKPVEFKAFYTKPTKTDKCSVEINFERDFNDQRFQYNLYAVFETGKIYYLKPKNDTVNGKTSLAFVEATPKGQRGAYFLKSWYTLTPILVDICNIGSDDPNFPPELKNKLPEKFSVQVVPFGVAHADKTVWMSNPFGFANENNTTPPILKDVMATKTFNNYPSNENIINVEWKPISNSEDIKGYFILAGPGKNAVKVSSKFIEDPKATQGQITIGYYTENYEVTVVTLAKNGALTSSAVVTQVNIEDTSC